jgi:hypothetical protein
MSLKPLILTGQKVLDGSVLAVGYDGRCFKAGSGLMALPERKQKVGFVHLAGGGLRGGDDFMGFIHRTVDLVAEGRGKGVRSLFLKTISEEVEAALDTCG